MSKPITSIADPHCHTVASDGMVTPTQLVKDAVGAGLDLIAVTDHDTMALAKETKKRGEAAGLEVVMGEEITTCWPGLTHILGLFLTKPVKSGMSITDTVKAIRDQGGLAIVPHPFVSTYFVACQPRMLLLVLDEVGIDGIEIEHTVPLSKRRKILLHSICTVASERVGAYLGASDSHFGQLDIAQVVTRYPGHSSEDFRQAILNRTTVPERLRTKLMIHPGLRVKQMGSNVRRYMGVHKYQQDRRAS